MRRILKNPQKQEEIDMPDPDGNTWLIDASRDGNYNLVFLLLERGADPFAKNNANETPLGLAERGGFDDVASLLRDFIEVLQD